MNIIVLKNNEELQELKNRLTKWLSPAAVRHDTYESSTTIEYPCVCSYIMHDDYNGPYYYDYEFISVSEINELLE